MIVYRMLMREDQISFRYSSRFHWQFLFENQNRNTKYLQRQHWPSWFFIHRRRRDGDSIEIKSTYRRETMWLANAEWRLSKRCTNQHFWVDHFLFSLLIFAYAHPPICLDQTCDTYIKRVFRDICSTHCIKNDCVRFLWLLNMAMRLMVKVFLASSLRSPSQMSLCSDHYISHLDGEKKKRKKKQFLYDLDSLSMSLFFSLVFVVVPRRTWGENFLFCCSTKTFLFSILFYSPSVVEEGKYESKIRREG